MSPEVITPWVLFVVTLPGLVVLIIMFIAAFRANTVLKRIIAMQEYEIGMVRKELNEATVLAETRRVILIEKDRRLKECPHCSGSQS
jgi:hypothetical protein